jgi:hypothetical protein
VALMPISALIRDGPRLFDPNSVVQLTDAV